VTRPGAVASGSESEARQQFVSDVFHTLSQPLTALRCSLELALMQDSDAQGYRTALEDALGHAERVTRCAEFLRLLAEADDPGTACEIDLRECVAAAVEEFAPVFETSGAMLAMRTNGRATIVADPSKVQRALFLALDFAGATGRDVKITLHRPGRAEIEFEGQGQLRAQSPSQKAEQSLELSQRMFRATGADVSFKDGTARSELRVSWHEVRE
jgi:signal transduction histidine kinase